MEKICEYLFENKEHIREGEYIKLMKLVKEAQEKEVDVYKKYEGVLIMPNEFDRGLDNYDISFITRNKSFELGKYYFQFDDYFEPNEDIINTNLALWNYIIRDNKWIKEKCDYLKEPNYDHVILVLHDEHFL